MIQHALSFDVENWYDGNLQRDVYRGPQDRRVEAETEAVMTLLENTGVKATFFVLGRVAARFPGLVRALALAGHEVASHGYDHELVYRQTPERFLADIRSARFLLEDLIGKPVLGYRAPSWSVTAPTLAWAPAAIAEAGYQYDSSVFPMRTPFYGIHSAPTVPWVHTLPNGGYLPELPPAVHAMGVLRVPFGGGIYWRLLPEPVLRYLLGRTTTSTVLYLHPWELNGTPLPVGQGLPLVPRLVLTVGVGRSCQLLRTMLAQFAFAPIHEVYSDRLGKEAARWAGGANSSVVTTRDRSGPSDSPTMRSTP